MLALTFEQFLNVAPQLCEDIAFIKRTLLEGRNEKSVESDIWFDIDQFCQYHPDKPAKPTIYGWVSAGLVPHHKSGKKLRFLKSEIDEWLKAGRRKTQSEIQAEADLYLEGKKKGGTR